jgi:prepilin-type N-terminal cleavage/methylation domain-containing protein
MIRLAKQSKGFTIIELMIATSVFSVILLVASAGIIRIGQFYYKGVSQSRTQDNIRTISDELSRSVQFAKDSKVSLIDTASQQRFCLGDTRYTAYLDAPFVQNTNSARNNPSQNTTGFWAEKLNSGATCSSACTGACASSIRQLLAVNTRVLDLKIEPIGAGIDKAWSVNVRVAYGDNDLLSHRNNDGSVITNGGADAQVERRKSAICKTGISASSFCATAELDTVIKKRLN